LECLYCISNNSSGPPQRFQSHNFPRAELFVAKIRGI
jgi:hypothetical protein